MGTIIRKDKAKESILSDANKTLTNATARGGRWKELADARLIPPLALVADIEAQHETAKAIHAPQAASIAVIKARANGVIGKTHDIIWNELGRPGHDAALSVIFPEGISSYTDGETSEQPDRMKILVTLLESGIHPQLSKATADAGAAAISLEATALEAMLIAARASGAKVKVLSRVGTALGKVVHAELSTLKRLYKAEGFTEAEIHTVIPDHPQKKKKAESP